MAAFVRAEGTQGHLSGHTLAPPSPSLGFLAPQEAVLAGELIPASCASDARRAWAELFLAFSRLGLIELRLASDPFHSRGGPWPPDPPASAS